MVGNAGYHIGKGAFSGEGCREGGVFATVAVGALSGAARAEDVGKVFSLGEVAVTTSAPTLDAQGGSTVTQDDLKEFNRDTLDRAINLVPGASTSAVGARNESNIWIRGFDRWRVPLTIDGIPIYLPYDNRLDFNRFTTSDIGEIQVTKGFTSVIDGPGALGGSVNLVSRQVTKPFEGDARLGSSFDQNGAFNGVVTDIFTGSKQDKWYVQASGTENYRNHWRLSDDYTPTRYENGGNRNMSYSQDYKINLKVGFTPSALDEYSLNFINQMGDKETPPPSTATATASKYWTWPDWDKQSVYWLSKTALDDIGSYVKVKAYYDRYYNVLKIWDNANYNTMASKGSEVSTYDDRGAGGSIEYSQMFLGGQDNLRTAFHYRWDDHNAQDKGNLIKAGSWITKPWTEDSENTYSAAIENIFHPARAWDLTTGVSYDYRQMLKAEDWNAPSSGNSLVHVTYPLSDKRAVNPEAALAYHFDSTGVAHVSVSDRTRFPTLFEMFSSRFGLATGNAYLQPEKSFNVETGVAKSFGQTRLGANIFHSRLRDAIESVQVTSSVSQNRNVGAEVHRGFELEASSQILQELEVGANYSYLLRQIQSYATLATETPKHKIFGYVNWQPIDKLSVVPSIEIGGKRWLQSTANTSYYYRGGDSALVDLKVSYKLTDNLEIEGGAKNLFDTNYVVEDGYNGYGRSYFTNIRVKF
ncbi:TonB-dependent receptor plug domain-containing protein [Telmatospirillum siberiense]|uniref:TonB-dependent receptor n=1 Tax=Telmatospirillum siberiense TaxID=382514 RepID=A0A2N3PYU6_9PROT|nr:TonB-dependent receptor [Telmatospirillum siberiense]PKU25594.1 TonB-dependent receptor [Telmatospirillum siberiense]